MHIPFHAESDIAWLLRDEHANTQDKNQEGLRRHLQNLWGLCRLLKFVIIPVMHCHPCILGGQQLKFD